MHLLIIFSVVVLVSGLRVFTLLQFTVTCAAMYVRYGRLPQSSLYTQIIGIFILHNSICTNKHTSPTDTVHSIRL
jgi:hypothetical protein